MKCGTLSVVAALVLLAIVTSSVQAMYHTRLGRFMQRDPYGTALMATSRMGTAGPSIGGGFLPRDTAAMQYVDGLNTYVGYHILHGGVDPFGLYNHWSMDVKYSTENDGKTKVCIQVYRMIDNGGFWTWTGLAPRAHYREGHGEGCITMCGKEKVQRMVRIINEQLRHLTVADGSGELSEAYAQSVKVVVYGGLIYLAAGGAAEVGPALTLPPNPGTVGPDPGDLEGPDDPIPFDPDYDDDDSWRNPDPGFDPHDPDQTPWYPWNPDPDPDSDPGPPGRPLPKPDLPPVMPPDRFNPAA